MQSFFAVVFLACMPAARASQNIVQLAEANPDLSTLVKALTAGGLTGTLSGTGPFTVFAPTNEAFAKIEPKALQALLADKKKLDKVLEYHVLAANFTMLELMSVKVAKTLEGESVEISDPSSSTIQVNNATVLKANLGASNGYVHIIDSLLDPPSSPPLPNKVDIVHLAQRNADLSTLVSALTAGKLVATLEGAGPFTVFAPSNEAFNKIPKAKLTQLLGDQKMLDQILEYHVLSGSFTMRDLQATKVIETLEKEEVVVRSIGNEIMINNADVTEADLEATNGFVHVIDKVLVPPDFPMELYSENIVELAESQPDLSTLVQALIVGKLTATLSGVGPYTVFAPTNEAFAKIPSTDLQKLLDNPTELDRVLEYHVLAGHFNMRDLMAVRSVATLEGDKVNVSGSGEAIDVNNAKVIKADLGATNGIVHLIDTVLMPPTIPNIVDFLQSTGNLSTLVAAVVAADLVEALSSSGPRAFNLFAPTNAAFAALPKGTLDRLLEPANKGSLVDILKNHVFTFDPREPECFSKLCVFKTLGGDHFVSDFRNNRNAALCDSEFGQHCGSFYKFYDSPKVSNGFVNIIDGVLLSPTSHIPPRDLFV
jgi:uncharacterized surface protein with fasciclin (FAS1) repeats